MPCGEGAGLDPRRDAVRSQPTKVTLLAQREVPSDERPVRGRRGSSPHYDAEPVRSRPCPLDIEGRITLDIRLWAIVDEEDGVDFVARPFWSRPAFDS